MLYLEVLKRSQHPVGKKKKKKKTFFFYVLVNAEI